ncbi:unnamed protein product [Urochloa humidicola]
MRIIQPSTLTPRSPLFLLPIHHGLLRPPAAAAAAAAVLTSPTSSPPLLAPIAMPRSPSSSQSNTAPSSSSGRRPYLCVRNLPARFKKKRLKKLFGAAEVEIDIEASSADLYFDSIEDGIRGLRFNSMELYDHQIITDWVGPYFTRTVFVQGFSSSLKHSAFLKQNKIHNIFALKQNKIHNMLAQHFRSCGVIKRISIPTLSGSGEVKGTAFIEFEMGSSILNALLLDKSYVDGFQLHVKLAHPKPGRPRQTAIFFCATGTKVNFSDSDDDKEDEIPRKIKFEED